jgi:DNA-binding CsgD family transcriptional regulator
MFDPSLQLGLGNFDTPRWEAAIRRARTLSGPRRLAVYGRLDDALARDAAPAVPWQTQVARDLFSTRVGCEVYQPIYGMDLGRLCVRWHRRAGRTRPVLRLEAEGVIEARASGAVLVASAHGEPQAPVRKRPQNPRGLSRREVEVLHLAAIWHTTQQIAGRLYISVKTADYQIQHIYAEIASRRGRRIGLHWTCGTESYRAPLAHERAHKPSNA